MLAQKRGQAFFHFPKVEGGRNVPCVEPEKRIRIGPIEDSVFVRLVFCAVTGVKVGRRVLGGADEDIRWEKGVQPSSKGLWIEVGWGAEVADLVEGMDPGVRSAGSDHPYSGAGHEPDLLLEDVLDSAGAGLALPSPIVCSVIPESHPDVPGFFHAKLSTISDQLQKIGHRSSLKVCQFSPQ